MIAVGLRAQNKTVRYTVRTAKEVVPGIEPGLPEDSEVIRIRSDNRYTTKPIMGFFLHR